MSKYGELARTQSSTRTGPIASTVEGSGSVV